MKRYILQTLDGKYLSYPCKENNYQIYTDKISEALLYTKKGARERIIGFPHSGEMYIRITVLIDE